MVLVRVFFQSPKTKQIEGIEKTAAGAAGMGTVFSLWQKKRQTTTLEFVKPAKDLRMCKDFKRQGPHRGEIHARRRRILQNVKKLSHERIGVQKFRGVFGLAVGYSRHVRCGDKGRKIDSGIAQVIKQRNRCLNV